MVNNEQPACQRAITTVNFKLNHPNAKLPTRNTIHDAGMDIYSAESVVIPIGGRKTISTGLSSEIEPGYVALLWDRSGNASKHGLKVMAGVIDSGFRGTWQVVLQNHGPSVYTVNVGDKIAQALVQAIPVVNINLVDELGDSERGVAGFGSSGR